MEVYVIRDWNLHFETAESRKRTKRMNWVAIPNKHDGKSFRRLMRKPNGLAIYGAFVLIVQVASKCPTRGVLADADGPLSAVDISDKTLVDADSISEALRVTSDPYIGWIDVCSYLPPKSARFSPESGQISSNSPDVDATLGESTPNLPKTGEKRLIHNRTDNTNTPLPPKGGGASMTLGVEDLKDHKRLAAWHDAGCPGLVPPVPSHLLAAVIATANECRTVGRRPMKLFWHKMRQLAATGQYDGPGDLYDDAKRLVAKRPKGSS